VSCAEKIVSFTTPCTNLKFVRPALNVPLQQ